MRRRASLASDTDEVTSPMHQPETLDELLGFAYARIYGLNIKEGMKRAGFSILRGSGDPTLINLSRRVIIPFYFEYCSPQLYPERLLDQANVEAFLRVYQQNPDDPSDGFEADLIRFLNGQVGIRSRSEWLPEQQIEFAFDPSRGAFVEPYGKSTDFKDFFLPWLQRMVVPRFVDTSGVPNFTEPIEVAEGTRVIALDQDGDIEHFSLYVVCQSRSDLKDLRNLGLEYGLDDLGVSQSGTVSLTKSDGMLFYICRLRDRNEDVLLSSVSGFARR